jgi:ABC-2 type transport system permease protein
MSVRNTLRALPTMLRIGFAEAVAYRAEMLVWVLATTMPLVMLALWTAVADTAPVGRFGKPQFVAYFLATFVVRQLTGSWAAWQINFEVREGTLSQRLLRPIHPLIGYAADNVAAMPMRVVVSVPVAVVLLIAVGGAGVAHSGTSWALFVVALVGGWALTLLANLVIGSLALFLESSLKMMDIYIAAYFVFSGYLIPVELFPRGIRDVTAWLPFQYQIGLPVELMTGAYDAAPEVALGLLARQWVMVALSFGAAVLVWKNGLRRFAAYGG